MRWFPRLYVIETVLCFSDGEAEARLLAAEWGGLVVEIIIARRVRTVGIAD